MAHWKWFCEIFPSFFTSPKKESFIKNHGPIDSFSNDSDKPSRFGSSPKSEKNRDHRTKSDVVAFQTWYFSFSMNQGTCQIIQARNLTQEETILWIDHQTINWFRLPNLAPSYSFVLEQPHPPPPPPHFTLSPFQPRERSHLRIVFFFRQLEC